MLPTALLTTYWPCYQLFYRPHTDHVTNCFTDHILLGHTDHVTVPTVLPTTYWPNTDHVAEHRPTICWALHHGPWTMDHRPPTTDHWQPAKLIYWPRSVTSSIPVPLFLVQPVYYYELKINSDFEWELIILRYKCPYHIKEAPWLLTLCMPSNHWLPFSYHMLKWQTIWVFACFVCLLVKKWA